MIPEWRQLTDEIKSGPDVVEDFERTTRHEWGLIMIGVVLAFSAIAIGIGVVFSVFLQ